MDDDAVSPVIGVILMVAITVVLAAVVFVVVSSITDDDGQDSGSMVGVRDEGRDKWQLISGTSLPQERFSFAADKVGVRYAWNETATAASEPLTTSAIQMQGSSPWAAGAYISLCADGASPVENLELTFINNQTNTVVAFTQFSSIEPCV